MENTNTPKFDSALATFVTAAQGIVDTHMSTHFPTLPREILSIEPGRRYVRIVKSNERDGGTSRHVYCFVDKTNGDILKCESWRKPAKHARGNIYTTHDFNMAVNQYGAHYMT